jgi:LmeA-like phospholipid-binding
MHWLSGSLWEHVSSCLAESSLTLATAAADRDNGDGSAPFEAKSCQACCMQAALRGGMRIGHPGFRQIALGVLTVLVLVLAASQLLLPGVAEQRVRERVSPYGSVRSVHVSGAPAIEMLWGKVDSMNVTTGQLRIGLKQMTNMVSSTRQVNNLSLASSGVDLTAGSLAKSGLMLRQVSFRKRGASLSGEATVSESDLRAALPSGFEVQPVASANGEIQVKANVPILGVESSFEGLVSAQEGKLVVQPTGIPFGALATLTLFSDPRIAVQGVSASQHSGGYDLKIEALLR